MLPIRYAGFYDVPRVFAVEREGCIYIFDCPFDDEEDEYPDKYVVYRLPDETLASTADAAWKELIQSAVRIGECAVSDVHFDVTRRNAIDDARWPAV